MNIIREGSALWQYVSPQQQILAGDGGFLLEDAKHHLNEEPTDYSYIVFPFAKMYEGFLKQLFLDTGIISDRDYRSDHFRIGKALSPHLVTRLGSRSAYGEVEKRYGKTLATRLWHTWKEARNLVFHYFPDNYRALTLVQAEGLIAEIIGAMEQAVADTHVRPELHS